MTTLTYTDTLQVIECGECHISFAVPVDFYKSRRADGRTFTCPHGDKISYGEGENARLKRQLEWAEASRCAARDQAAAAERSARAYKGAATRVKRRVANGVCPCCNRTFADLARHMAGQHPHFEASDG